MLLSKYHGCGNNFVIVREDELRKDVGERTGGEPADERGFLYACQMFAKRACSESIGVGADGLIVVREEPALEMLFFNRDGSRAPMCGNGIRCFAHYCYETGICRRSAYPVQTLAGEMIVNITNPAPFRVKINMGRPVFDPDAIGVDSPGKDFLDQELMLGDGECYQIHGLFMGTIHTVIFVDDFDEMDIEKIGKEVCNHPTFKEKTNVNFVRIKDETSLEMKTYERGVGMTLACGTGACASVIVANRKGLCQTKAEVILALGSLMIEISENGDVYMEGPSTKVLDGTFW